MSARGVPVSKDEAMNEGTYLYIVRCADDSYYCGTTRKELEARVAEHNAGHFGGYTAKRLPVTLVFAEWFDNAIDAITAERQIKGWSRAKKEAFMRGDFDALRLLSRRRTVYRGE
jgi:putative endonuclease